MEREQTTIASDERLLTTEDVAHRLGVTPQTIARMKDLPRLKLSATTVRFPESALNAFLSSKMGVAS